MPHILTVTTTEETPREVLRVEIPDVESPSKAFVAIIQALDALNEQPKPKVRKKRSDAGKSKKALELAV